MIAVIKYNSGNTKSVLNALFRIGANPIITDDAEIISRAEKIIFPGVGEAGSAMAYLKKTKLDNAIKKLHQPFLGICLGMQLLCSHSEEGDTECIGIFNEKIKKFPPGQKIPHMGWNTISNLKSPLFKNIPAHQDVYFVHSYFAELGKETIATSGHGIEFSAALQKNNFFGVQFHPEKSAAAGELILQNFLSL